MFSIFIPAMVFEIYAWGKGSDIAPFDLNSQLLNVLLTEYNIEHDIIANSNIFKSNSGKLPFIEMGENRQITDFINIWTHVAPDLFEFDDLKTKLTFKSFLNNLIFELNLITDYNYFVNKLNYEKFSRSLFKSYLPWPTQYKPPLDLHYSAVELCFNEAIIDNENDEFIMDAELDNELIELRKQEKHLKETPVINEYQKAQIDKELTILSEKKSIFSNLKCLKRLGNLFNNYGNLKSKLPEETTNFFKIILFTFMKCNINSQLFDGFIHSWLKREQPDFLLEMETHFREKELTPSRVSSESSRIPLKTAILTYVSELA